MRWISAAELVKIPRVDRLYIIIIVTNLYQQRDKLKYDKLMLCKQKYMGLRSRGVYNDLDRQTPWPCLSVNN